MNSFKNVGITIVIYYAWNVTSSLGLCTEGQSVRRSMTEDCLLNLGLHRRSYSLLTIA